MVACFFMTVQSPKKDFISELVIMDSEKRIYVAINIFEDYSHQQAKF